MNLVMISQNMKSFIIFINNNYLLHYYLYLINFYSLFINKYLPITVLEFNACFAD